ncbi:MAG TPA: alpha/beta hydrolase family protein [Terriglobales bacterium]|nr:alpha/beta hydrolase family protein [Terriglobales bacterium]
MPHSYAQWMYAWETRLNARDNNRVVRPLDWGVEWTQAWPCRNGSSQENPEHVIRELNRRILARSDEFFSYRTPADFRLEPATPASGGQSPANFQEPAVPGPPGFLRFTSPVATPCPENNIVHARWFPAVGDCAMVVLPQWNADAESHNALCRIFNFLGVAALRLSLPYHDLRKPPEIERADYAVSANIGRTLDAARQAVLDARSCLDWLQAQGYRRFGIVGTSLGSCYAFITAAHEPRLSVCAFNHASTYFADVVWTGQSTRHIRAGLDGRIDLERLRQAWLAISPMSYFDHFARYSRRSLVVYARYDLTFLPEFSLQFIAECRRRGLRYDVSVLPCGHYSCGEFPFKYLDAWYLAKFIRRAFPRV